MDMKEAKEVFIQVRIKDICQSPSKGITFKVVSSNVTQETLLTYLLHGADSFMSSYLVCSQSRNSPHFTELKGSLPHSQAHATCQETLQNKFF